VIKSRKTNLKIRVAGIRKARNSYDIFLRTFEKKTPFGGPKSGWEDNYKMKSRWGFG
jgi:hypothetical protein